MDYYDVEKNTPPYVMEYTMAAPKTKEEVIVRAKHIMKELEGWCSEEKAAKMIDLIYHIRAKTIVEIGVFGGKSLLPMGVAVKSIGEGVVYGVDPWQTEDSIAGESDPANKDWWASIDHEAIYQGVINKIAKFGLRKHVKLIRASSADAPEIPNIDLLHIDGNHSEETSMIDVLKWVPLVRTGGFIVFDDMDWSTTKKASTWLNENCTKFAEFKGDNVWGVWIKR